MFIIIKRKLDGSVRLVTAFRVLFPIALTFYMDTQTIDSIREVFHNGSIVLLAFGIGLAIIGSLKPRALGRVFHEFSRRRYILLTAIFVCLLSGTVFTATQPDPETFHSNAPRPTTHNTAQDFNDLSEQPLSESAVQATESQPALESALETPPSQDQAAAPPNQSKDSSPATSTPASPPASSNPKPAIEDSTKKPEAARDCRLELLFLCF
jgi:hypothetical protein